MFTALLALHVVLGIVLVGYHRRLGRRGFAIAAVPAAAMLVALATRLDGVLDGDPVVETVQWVPALDLEFSVRIDAFAALMVLIVSGIGLLVSIYAVSYFSHPKPGTGRLAGLMTIFAGGMLGVVVSDHLLALFVFWELTTITSYLLIGNDDRDPRARHAALMAILITGAGGLVMLAGFVIVGQAAGTYRIGELAGAVPDGGAVITAGAICILVGAFTKSAQFPFSTWLPGAMVAPTPVSTYLHAATMVKAGVFLLARLSPALSGLAGWQPLVVTIGAITMVAGGWRALRQHDLKVLLAHGTVSQLGFLTMLVGFGAYDLFQAGAVLLLAHAAFKAALFMVVGVVDHQAGTRDVRRLGGLGPGWRPITVVAVVSAASMAGVPPVLGFIAKEKALDASLGASTPMVVAIVVGSVLTFAYSGRFVLGVLGRLADDEHDPVVDAPVASRAFVAAPVLLTAFTVVAGLAPVVIDRLVRASVVAVYPASKPKHVVLWAGVNTALFLSIGIIAVGIAIVAAHRRVEAVQGSFHRIVRGVPSGEQAFDGSVSGLLGVARRTTAVVQNGSLAVYLLVILTVVAFAPLGPAIASFDDLPELVGPEIHVALGIVMAGAAIGAAVIRRRIAAALMLGAVGFAMAGLFVAQGAPDLALTQLAIETLATVLFVLVLRFLPRRFDDPRPPIIAPLRLIVAAATGVSVFVFALVAAGSRSSVDAPQISDEMLARSVPDGYGSNVVNVILVDFRGLDTLGEITVLVVAALGAVSLARTFRRERPPDGGPASSGFARLPVVSAASRVLFASIVILSLYFLFAGHNQPGGGFVGGLAASAAISLRYIDGGVEAVRRILRVPPWSVLGTGLALSVGTAMVPLLTGNEVLEHSLFEGELPLIGTIKATSALPFDVGVYLVVVGLVLMAFEAFGDEYEHDEPETGGTEPTATPSGERVP